MRRKSIPESVSVLGSSHPHPNHVKGIFSTLHFFLHEITESFDRTGGGKYLQCAYNERVARLYDYWNSAETSLTASVKQCKAKVVFVAIFGFCGDFVAAPPRGRSS